MGCEAADVAGDEVVLADGRVVATQLSASPCRWGRNRNERLALQRHRLDSGHPQDGVVGLVGGEGQCRHDIGGFQVGKVFQNLRLGGAGGEHLQEVSHPDPESADTGPAAADMGVEGDSGGCVHRRLASRDLDPGALLAPFSVSDRDNTTAEPGAYHGYLPAGVPIWQS